MSFVLNPLPYAFDALEPHIDAKTMEIHHDKHHAAYVNNLNAALANSPQKDTTIEEILSNISNHEPAVRNNGGGHYNHDLFWSILGPNTSGENIPTGTIAQAINDSFGSFENFKTKFAEAGTKRFGSGWAWLLKNKEGQLEISSTPNQDNPLMDIAEIKGTPILGMDVWEHAYYLHYQNRRPDYINAFFNVINWSEVERRYLAA
jgi:Fe-Mn family superoxide dismutase